MKPISEYKTRKTLIDKALQSAGWVIAPHSDSNSLEELTNHAIEEYPTDNGPADYALFVDGLLLGIIEAKKLTVSPQNVLEQAKRYSKGAKAFFQSWGEYNVPLLFSTNGELIYFLDVRNEHNLSRQLYGFYNPQALKQIVQQDTHVAFNWLSENPIDNQYLRPYQKDAIHSIEQNMEAGKRQMMVAMATGTGKTFMTVNLVYRLLKSGVAKRILFLVDRKSLAAQAVVAFASFETPRKLKFNQEYEMYSQRFRKDDFEEGEKFDPSVLPNAYLTEPDDAKTFLYVATIQRMAINLYGQDAIFDSEEAAFDTDAERLPIPIHAFDVIIADECHRGYTSRETNVWRSVLNHFDAVKIGLTATPASHTIAYFGEPVFTYRMDEAIEQGFLVDWDAVAVKSNVLIEGAFLKEGEKVGIVDVDSGAEVIDQLDDERDFDSASIERDITAPDTNHKIIQELKTYADEFERERSHFPKTLIFAANDAGHTSHAERLVRICKEVFNRGDDFVAKITGNANVDRPLKRIREFRNRPNPKIVVTVDMLSTGVDIPGLEYIVFLRPVKSRILWEQMLGRGTRKCDDINKTHFVIFDCFNGTLIKYFKDASNNFKIEPPTKETLSIRELIEKIYNGEDRYYNAKRLGRRMHRIEKEMSGKARDQFARFIPDGDMGAFAETMVKFFAKYK